MARECFERALKVNPKYALALNNLGVIYERMGELKKALDCYKRALEASPGYEHAKYNYERLRRRLGRHSPKRG